MILKQTKEYKMIRKIKKMLDKNKDMWYSLSERNNPTQIIAVVKNR